MTLSPATEAPYQPQPGDLVRCVVSTARVESVGLSGVSLVAEGGAVGLETGHCFLANTIGPTWTLLEPAPPAPVVTFGPGDIVMGKSTGAVYSLADTLYIEGGKVHEYDDDDVMFLGREDFTSERFERHGGTA